MVWVEEPLLYRLGASLLAAACLLLLPVSRSAEWRRDNARRLLWVAVALLAAAVAVRWQRLGHGPFLSMYEILLSNVVSLGVLSLGLMQWLRAARPALPAVAFTLAMLAGWGLVESDAATVLPPTYDHPWLWLHIGFGKPFLALLLVSSGLAVDLVIRRTMSRPGARNGAQQERLLWRLFSAAFVFEGLMLIAGAVWARDAWGRYWQWDPLETWALLTWVLAALVLHLRVTRRLGPSLAAGGVVVVLVVAFLTFFGVPFLSPAPHKGAV